jgi:uncharacterized membrane protein YeaQ/YmgE (transglycosylase-associated protein family)
LGRRLGIGAGFRVAAPRDFKRQNIFLKERDMNGVGWLGAIIIGGIAGWLAEKVMRSDMSVLMNIILGIIGAVVLNALLAALGVTTGAGWLPYLITGFIGACILIFLGRLIRR